MMDIEFENQLRSIATEMEYPPTPDIARFVTKRLNSASRPRFISRSLAWSLTIILVLLSSIMVIPTARAAVIEFIQIGVVRIFPRPAEPAPPTSETIRTAVPDIMAPFTATPEAHQPSLIPLLDTIAGETKLANAQETAPYPILLPTFPQGLGGPNHVYIQAGEGVMTILVWVNPQQPELATMSLHFIPAGHWSINKMGPFVIQETEVDGQSAIWAEGPYPLVMSDGKVDFIRLIEGHVLIWTDGDLTYRLETDLSLEEAVRVAESLEPIP